MAEPAALSEMDAATAGLAVSLRAVTKVYDSGVVALGPLDLDVCKGGLEADRRPQRADLGHCRRLSSQR